jgi:hypothetical protein
MLRSKRRKREPVDQRRLEQDRFLREYGSFLALWSTFDLAIEIAIMRELRLSPQEASIVCAGLGFGAKTNVLYSLLSRDENNESKVAAVKEAQRLAVRNSFAHGFLFRDDEIARYCLVRREVKERYSIKSRNLDSATMTEHGLDFGALFSAAMNALKITEADLDSYAQSIRDDVIALQDQARRRRESRTSSRSSNR